MTETESASSAEPDPVSPPHETASPAELRRWMLGKLIASIAEGAPVFQTDRATGAKTLVGREPAAAAYFMAAIRLVCEIERALEAAAGETDAVTTADPFAGLPHAWELEPVGDDGDGDGDGDGKRADGT